MVVIEGPRFSTRAESTWYAAQGWSVVNMTGHPEAVLARELALCFTAVALVTDLDAGVDDGDAVTQEEVFRVFAGNTERMRNLVLRDCRDARSRPSVPVSKRAGRHPTADRAALTKPLWLDHQTPAGRRTVKRQPAAAFATETSPPCRSTGHERWRAQSAATPRGSGSGLRAAAPRNATSKTRGRSDSGIPPHSSVTVTHRRSSRRRRPGPPVARRMSDRVEEQVGEHPAEFWLAAAHQAVSGGLGLQHGTGVDPDSSNRSSTRPEMRSVSARIRRW